MLSNMKAIKRYFKRFLGLFPSRLPVGMIEHQVWVDEIIDLSGLPNNASTQFSVATMVLHAPAYKGYMSKEYFVRHLIKGAANQVAHYRMTELKEEQQRLAEAEKAKAEAEKLQIVEPDKEPA